MRQKYFEKIHGFVSIVVYHTPDGWYAEQVRHTHAQTHAKGKAMKSHQANTDYRGFRISGRCSTGTWVIDRWQVTNQWNSQTGIVVFFECETKEQCVEKINNLLGN